MKYSSVEARDISEADFKATLADVLRKEKIVRNNKVSGENSGDLYL